MSSTTLAPGWASGSNCCWTAGAVLASNSPDTAAILTAPSVAIVTVMRILLNEPVACRPTPSQQRGHGGVGRQHSVPALRSYVTGAIRTLTRSDCCEFGSLTVSAFASKLLYSAPSIQHCSILMLPGG